MMREPPSNAPLSITPESNGSRVKKMRLPQSSREQGVLDLGAALGKTITYFKRVRSGE